MPDGFFLISCMNFIFFISLSFICSSRFVSSTCCLSRSICSCECVLISSNSDWSSASSSREVSSFYSRSTMMLSETRSYFSKSSFSSSSPTTLLCIYFSLSVFSLRLFFSSSLSFSTDSTSALYFSCRTRTKTLKIFWVRVADLPCSALLLHWAAP